MVFLRFFAGFPLHMLQYGRNISDKEQINLYKSEKTWYTVDIPGRDSSLPLKEVHIDEEFEAVGTALEGMTFVITGSLNHYENRDALKTEIEKQGGKVAGSVSAKTSCLINNDLLSQSGKNKKAKELGIKILDEETIMKWLETGVTE